VTTNPLPEKYYETYDRMLEVIGSKGMGSQKLAAFTVQIGSEYEPGGLMICGRAVNGSPYPQEWTLEEMTRAKRREIVDAIREHTLEPNLPASQFWRVAKGIATHPDFRRALVTENWADEICWNDLYKIGPSETGNPSEKLRRAQFDQCVELLQLELEYLDPKAVIIMAGEDWYSDFTKKLSIGLEPFRNWITHVAKQGGRAWILGVHPDRKPVSASDYVAQVVAAYEKLTQQAGRAQ